MRHVEMVRLLRAEMVRLLRAEMVRLLRAEMVHESVVNVQTYIQPAHIQEASP